MNTAERIYVASTCDGESDARLHRGAGAAHRGRHRGSGPGRRVPAWARCASCRSAITPAGPWCARQWGCWSAVDWAASGPGPAAASYWRRPRPETIGAALAEHFLSSGTKPHQVLDAREASQLLAQGVTGDAVSPLLIHCLDGLESGLRGERSATQSGDIARLPRVGRYPRHGHRPLPGGRDPGFARGGHAAGLGVGPVRALWRQPPDTAAGHTAAAGQWARRMSSRPWQWPGDPRSTCFGQHPPDAGLSHRRKARSDDCGHHPVPAQRLRARARREPRQSGAAPAARGRCCRGWRVARVFRPVRSAQPRALCLATGFDSPIIDLFSRCLAAYEARFRASLAERLFAAAHASYFQLMRNLLDRMPPDDASALAWAKQESAACMLQMSQQRPI